MRTYQAHSKLSDKGATDTELLSMLNDVLPSVTTPMTAREIGGIIEEQYGRVISHRRIAMMMSNNIPWVKKVGGSYAIRDAFKWVTDGVKYAEKPEYISQVPSDRPVGRPPMPPHKRRVRPPYEGREFFLVEGDDI